MQSTNYPSSARDDQRATFLRDELAERIILAIQHDGTTKPLDGLELRRASAPVALGHGMTYPALCLAVQGSKETQIGDRTYRYDPAHYMIVSAALPYATQITEASLDQPFLGIVLALEPQLVGSVMVEAGRPAPTGRAAVTAVDVSPLKVDVLDAMARLVRLLDAPADARLLAPMIKREIVYRLLADDQGEAVRHIATLGGDTNRIARAIERLRHDFDQPLRVSELAHDLGMSLSSFHQHFKAVTAMSPLEFQKQLRLQEARRLMLADDIDAASAAYRVGYHDASHFSREYKRLFGEPPIRDVERLRGTPALNAYL